MKEKKPKLIAFDETFPHPERASVDPDREQYPCIYLINVVARKSWEHQSTISHKVAVMKATLITQIANDNLVNHWCEDNHGDVQIQGAVQNMDDLEFIFAESRSSWSYESPDHIVEETIAGRAICAATIKFEPLRDEFVPSLPPALWLMDTGCGHDLVNDMMAEDFPVKTPEKVIQNHILHGKRSYRIKERGTVLVQGVEAVG